jgi:hypothetical protein
MIENSTANRTAHDHWRIDGVSHIDLMAGPLQAVLKEKPFMLALAKCL